ncbi:MAG: hypothetical protein HY708_04320 [Ignavibacteriae bacterium]|nr:hypothetical protein [Ignavibacteriota bacterium]
MCTLHNARFILLLSLALAFTDCATVKNGDSISVDDYRRQIASLQSKLSVNPGNADFLRELGVIYFLVKEYPQAKEHLERSYYIQPGDAKTIFYYGMALETLNNQQGALAVYINYTDFSALSPYRKLIEGRYRALTRDIIEQQVQKLIADEAQLGEQNLSPATVAVFPLSYQGTDQKYATLGKGLSELMISDLAQVARLKLVERIRIEALLTELRFATSDKVDPASAPRLGKLLSAGRIVSGTYNVSADNVMRVDVVSLDILERQFPPPATQTDALENLFRLQKDLVFDVLDKMGITLTRVERERIERIPTRNLQAFILYSIGIERDDARDFDGAAVYYQQAVSLDPGFSQAKTKAEAAEALSAAGTKDRAVASAHKADPPPPPDAEALGSDFVNKRLETLGSNIGSSFYPSQDTRKPAEEGSNAGAPVGDLPKPPPPPVK